MRFRSGLPTASPRASLTYLHILPSKNAFLLFCGLLLTLGISLPALAQNPHAAVAASSSRASRNFGLGQIASIPDSDLQGTLQIISQDLPKQHILSYFLDTESSSLELHFVSGDPVGYMTGDHISVRGKNAGKDFYLMNPSYMKKAGASTFAPSGPLALASANTFGNQSTIVLLVNFIDDTSHPLDPDVIQDIVFSGTDTFYREVSQNQTWITGTVHPDWLTVPLSSKTCAFTDLSRFADAAAKDAGLDLTLYKHVIYAFHTTACDFIGASYLGGNRVWANGDIRVEVIAHELAHNLGLYHSHAWDCNGASTGSNCKKIEYGDTFDVMGDVLAAHFNAYQKERLGYLNYGTSLPLTTVTTSGIYDISPYEYFIPNVSPSKALKIVTDLDPTLGLYNLLYVEYRQNLGFDTSLSPYPDATAGVLIHQTSSVRADSSYLLDTHPQTHTFDDAALLPGESFIEPQSGTSIQLLSADADGASVKVTFGKDACSYAQPTVTLSPSSYSVPPGTTVNFAVTIKNNNGPTCDDSVFSLSNSSLAGFTASLDKSSITLAHGASGSATFTVTSDPATSGGNYRLFVLAKDNAGGLSGAGSGSYIVSAPFSLSASSSSVSIAQGGSSTINVTSTINPPFSNSVSLDISGVPAGVMSGFAPSTFPAPGSGKSVLSLLVAPNATPGIYSLTITGTGGGLTQQVPLTLTINSSGNFALAVSPTSINVLKGGSNTAVVASNIVGSFMSGVSLSISGLPPSLTASFSPTTVPSPGNGTSTLTISADNSATVGSSYMLTITGVGSGLTRTTPISVTITGAQPPPPPPGISAIPVTGYKLVSADSQEMQCGIHSATAAFDGNPNSFWESQDCLATRPLPHELQIDLGASYNIAGFKYLPRQDSQPTGKVRDFKFYVSNSSQNWGNPATTGTLITFGSDVSEKQVLLNTAVSGRYIRFVATSEVNGGQISTVAELTALQTSTPPPPPVSDFSLAAQPSSLTVVQGNSTNTKITSTLSGMFSSSIALSTGSLPNGVTAAFNPTPIAAPGSGDSTLTFNTSRALPGTYPITVTGTGGGKVHSLTVSLTITSQNPPPPGLTPISQTGWKLTYVDSQESQCGLYVGAFAFDGKPNTFWQTQNCLGGPPQPHEIRIDLGASYTIQGFRYLPRQDGQTTGKIANFEFYVSTDGVNWGSPAATGTLITVPTDTAEKQIVFNAPVTGRFVRLRSLSEVNGGKATSVAVLNLLL
jgi:hypothetical protein